MEFASLRESRTAWACRSIYSRTERVKLIVVCEDTYHGIGNIWHRVHRTIIIIRSTCAEPNMSNSLNWACRSISSQTERVKLIVVCEDTYHGIGNIWHRVHRTIIIIRSTCAEPNMWNSLNWACRSISSQTERAKLIVVCEDTYHGIVIRSTCTEPNMSNSLRFFCFIKIQIAAMWQF